MESSIDRLKVEGDERWLEKSTKMPWIKFPSDWKIQIIPPYAGALVRFRVDLPDGRIKSVYLDCFERLGFFGQPYWEVYPCDGDTFRCAMANVDELLEGIDSVGSLEL